jgi:uncharacterized protein (TIGR03067 family)
MRMDLLAIVSILVATKAPGQDVPPLPPTSIATAANFAANPELVKLFNGYWKPESVIADGVEQLSTPEAKASIILRIRNGEYAIFAIKDAKNDTGLRLCTAQLTLQQEPRTFELLITDGFRKGQRLHGIYDFAGERLRICYGPAELPRPTTFDAPKDSGRFCETWRKEAKSTSAEDSSKSNR